ncbi:glycoside hydrolase family 18 [Prevotella sp. S7 MS 2]|uniref:glycoside hydrolase family 18 n=1 Tax=Prevotella sp. S7 MS 2 TaxID=1287488 RepID=UPI00056876CF|nr:glycoside hydrolase family 18 [Prevotella sp. S7 MS 2]
MKNFKYYTLFLAFVAGIGLSSCADMIEVENKPFDHIGGYNTMNNEKSEEYYANLREYKKQAMNYGRPVAFGWFSSWMPAGVGRHGYLASMPDSMDIVSMWSGAPNRFEITPQQKADKEFVQKVKGTKLLEVCLIGYIGKGRTPQSVYDEVDKKATAEGWFENKQRLTDAYVKARWKFWGYEGVPETKNHYECLDKYANALVDSLIANDWDGYDIDWEPGSGTFDLDGTCQTDEHVIYLIKKMGERIGPNSDPEGKGHKLLCYDGDEIAFKGELDPYIDYWIAQTYGRFPSINHLRVDSKKFILTENFEKNFEHGGLLLRHAALMPDKGYKGGFGAYRFDNDYDNMPNYKWMRRAIQINQEVFQKRKAEEAGTEGK